MKEKKGKFFSYEAPKVEVIEMEAELIIATSGSLGEDLTEEEW